jgi:hypothetical protein
MKNNVTELFSLNEPILHPEKWVPDEKDKPKIVTELLNYYLGTLDNCGPDDEQTAEAHELYMQVLNHPLSDCKNDVQNFFADTYWAVHGEIERYYGNDPEFIDLINLTVCPE